MNDTPNKRSELLVFEGGSLSINVTGYGDGNGKASLVVRDEDLSDCDSDGSFVHKELVIDASEIQEIRRFLNRVIGNEIPASPAADFAKGCPSTHCNRREECASPNDCIRTERLRDGIASSPEAGSGAPTVSGESAPELLPTAEQFLFKLLYEGCVRGFEGSSWDEVQKKFRPTTEAANSKTIETQRREIEQLREADRKSELLCKEMLIRCADAIRTDNAIQGCRVELQRRLADARDGSRDPARNDASRSFNIGLVTGIKEAIELLNRHATP